MTFVLGVLKECININAYDPHRALLKLTTDSRNDLSGLNGIVVTSNIFSVSKPKKYGSEANILANMGMVAVGVFQALTQTVVGEGERRKLHTKQQNPKPM